MMKRLFFALCPDNEIRRQVGEINQSMHTAVLQRGHRQKLSR